MGLLPTLGAALFIGFGQEHGLSRRLLALAPVVYLGKLSYSWYLFHWPVIVMFRKLGIDGVFPALGTGLGLAILCHHGIEQPLRRLREEWVLTRVVVPVMLIGVSTYLLSRSDFRPRIELAPPVVWCGLDLVPSRTQEKPNPHCITPDLTLYPDRTVRRTAAVHGPVRVVILGDSHLTQPFLRWTRSWVKGGGLMPRSLRQELAHSSFLPAQAPSILRTQLSGSRLSVWPSTRQGWSSWRRTSQLSWS